MAKRFDGWWVRAAVLAALFVSGYVKAQSTGADFGTRNAHTCKDTKQPAKGVPTGAQLKEYVTCELEHVQGAYLYLAENVSVEIGKGRPYSVGSEPFAGDIDTSAPVYPIRGSYTEYQCGQVRGFPINNAGKNCTVTERPKAEGKCYKTTFGDWACSMRDLNVDYKAMKANLPPPPK